MGKFRLGELFCGPGGLAYGAITAKIGDERFSIEHVWANDYDKNTCDTYVRNICPNNPDSVVCGDVRKLDLSKIPEIDALVFGFPCNDFSVVGEQKGFAGSYGPLYMYGVQVLKLYQPKWFGSSRKIGGLGKVRFYNCTSGRSGLSGRSIAGCRRWIVSFSW